MIERKRHYHWLLEDLIVIQEGIFMTVLGLICTFYFIYVQSIQIEDVLVCLNFTLLENFLHPSDITKFWFWYWLMKIFNRETTMLRVFDCSFFLECKKWVCSTLFTSWIFHYILLVSHTLKYEKVFTSWIPCWIDFRLS